MNVLDPARRDTISQAWRGRIAALGAFVVPFMIVAVALLISQQVRSANDLRAAEIEVQERRAMIMSILSAHQDIETASRGYVITGNAEFLEPYEEGSRELDRIAPQLRAALLGSPGRLAELDAMTRASQQKRAFVDGTIALVREGEGTEAIKRVAGGRGRALMDEIRLHIGRLIALEQIELAGTSSRSQAAISRLRNVTFGLLGVMFVLLAIATLAIVRSLRVRNTALAELEDISLRRAAILDNANDGIVTLNPSGSIESANAATLRMFGYELNELERRDVGVLFASQPRPGAVAERLRDMDLLGAGAANATEIPGRCKDGTTFSTEVAVSAVQLHEGLRYVAVIRDITERKRVEQMKTEFVSTVSHELRTPLTSIAGSLGLLAGGAAGALDERPARLIGIAHNNVNRLIRLINDILDIEKIESGKMPFDNRRLDLAEAIAASIEENRSYAEGYGVDVSFVPPGESVQILADRDRLAQVFANLISNAVKFSDRGGRVEVTVLPGRRWHRVSVSDTGPGIPDNFRDRIFGKFAQADASDTRQKGGTGLGLAIVREIVERSGGRVGYETELGEGTTFHVDLPALRPEATDEGAARRLLVCGDKAAAVLSGALEEAGYDVHLLANPERARELLQTCRFDGILVDMGLADGAGIKIIRTAREMAGHADTPVIAIGGQPGSKGVQGDAALVLDWLRQPDEVDRIAERIEQQAGVNAAGLPLVLHIEDDPDVAQVVAAAFENRAQVVNAPDIAGARALLAQSRFDVAVLDIGLADGNGLDLLPDLQRDRDLPIPIVVFSAQDSDPEMASKVDAYLNKARAPLHELVALVGRLTARTAPEPENTAR